MLPSYYKCNHLTIHFIRPLCWIKSIDYSHHVLLSKSFHSNFSPTLEFNKGDMLLCTNNCHQITVKPVIIVLNVHWNIPLLSVFSSVRSQDAYGDGNVFTWADVQLTFEGNRGSTSGESSVNHDRTSGALSLIEIDLFFPFN